MAQLIIEKEVAMFPQWMNVSFKDTAPATDWKIYLFIYLFDQHLESRMLSAQYL